MAEISTNTFNFIDSQERKRTATFNDHYTCKIIDENGQFVSNGPLSIFYKGAGGDNNRWWVTFDYNGDTVLFNNCKHDPQQPTDDDPKNYGFEKINDEMIVWSWEGQQTIVRLKDSHKNTVTPPKITVEITEVKRSDTRSSGGAAIGSGGGRQKGRGRQMLLSLPKMIKYKRGLE